MVYSGRHDRNEEGILISGIQRKLGAASEQEWTDVETGAAFGGGDEFGVAGDGEVDGFKEEGFGDRGHGDVGGGFVEAGGIGVWAEDGDFVGGRAEGFEAFVALLAVVEGGGEDVEGKEGGGDEFGLGPACSGGVGCDGVAVGGGYAEADLAPV